MAPEIVLQQEHGEKADAWSLGCVAYEMLSGKHPFEGQDAKDILACHQRFSVFDEPDYRRDHDLALLIDGLHCARMSDFIEVERSQMHCPSVSSRKSASPWRIL